MIKCRNTYDIFNIILFVLTQVIICAAILIVKIQNNDDLQYQSATYQYSFWHFVYNHEYLTWSGRVSANGLLYLIFKINPLIYKIIAPLFILLTSYSISKVFIQKVNLKYLLLITLSFGLISHRILGESILWITGSFNYLVPVSCGLFAMIPYIDNFYRNINKIKTFLFIITAIAIIISVLGNEQIAMVMIVFTLIFHIIQIKKRKPVNIYLYFLTTLIIVGTAINLFAPGNRVRWFQELHWLPGFNQLSLINHIELGISWFVKSISTQFISIIFSLSLIPILLKRKVKPKFNFYLFLTQIGILILLKLISIFIYIPEIIINTFWILFLINLFLLIIQCSTQKFFTFLCLMTGLLSLIIMWFSPTIYASANRVMYVTSLLWIIVIISFIDQLKLIRNKKLIVLFFIFFLINFCSPFIKIILNTFSPITISTNNFTQETTNFHSSISSLL